MLLVALLHPASANEPADEPRIDTRDQVREEIALWAASRLGIPESAVEVGALDRRTRIQPCPEGRRFAFPFAAKTTVQVTCPSSDWQLFVRVEIRQPGPVVVAARNLESGTVLTEGDLRMQAMTNVSELAIEDLQLALGRSLRRDLFAGEAVLKPMLNDTVLLLRLHSPVEAGAPITEHAEVISMSATEAPSDALRQGTASDPIAAFNLPAGRLLLRSDIIDVQPTVVSATTLRRGTRLTPGMTRIERLDRGKLPEDVLNSTTGLTQMEVIRTIGADEPLRASDLRAARLVRRGEMVTVILRRGNLEIASTAEALEDGRSGQVIGLIHPESGKRLRARVIGVGQAEMVGGRP